MASKLQYVSELADQTTHNVTRNVNGWKSYLSVAARLYKYDFDDQSRPFVFVFCEVS